MQIEDAIKNAPTDVLCKAAGTLQKAHDKIESQAYFSVGDYGANGGNCCYIGSVRQVSGERACTPWEVSEHRSSDLALYMLDKAAIDLGARSFTAMPGHIAEVFGMENSEYGRNKESALRIYRDALRLMHTELMERDDLPVGTSA